MQSMEPMIGKKEICTTCVRSRFQTNLFYSFSTVRLWPYDGYIEITKTNCYPLYIHT